MVVMNANQVILFLLYLAMFKFVKNVHHFQKNADFLKKFQALLPHYLCLPPNQRSYLCENNKYSLAWKHFV